MAGIISNKNMKNKGGSGRTSRQSQQSGVTAAIMQRVIEGRYKPGSQLPSRRDLAVEFGTSTITIQRAFERLTEEGFLSTVPREGTFVATNPPHTCAYGLAISESESPDAAYPMRYARFAALLVETARRWRPPEGKSLRIYTEVDDRVLGESYYKLRSDVLGRRLAGVISNLPWHQEQIARESPVPMVAACGTGECPGVHAIDLSPIRWMDRAAQRLRERGVRRIAVIMHGHQSIEHRQRTIDRLAGHELRLQRRFLHSGHVRDPQNVRALVELMFSLPADERPQGLLITDDIYTEHALTGLLDAGVRCPDDLQVISHANFPTPEPVTLPVMRLGWDVNLFLEESIRLIDKISSGRGGGEPCVLEPLFGDELNISGVPALQSSQKSGS